MLRRLLFALFLTPFIVLAQIPLRPRVTPAAPKSSVPSSAFRGDVIVPITKAERAQMARTHKIIWKHIYLRLPINQLDSKRMMAWIDNFTHPGPTSARDGEKDWLDYDPRNVRVTNRYISFDAPAGDHIFCIVGER